MSAIFGEILNLGQRNGQDVPLKVFGDEHYARYENLAGFTAVYDEELGIFCHARLSASVLTSTGVPTLDPPPPGIVAHLQESQDVIAAKSQSQRQRRVALAGGVLADEVVNRTLGPNQGLLTGRVLSLGAVKGLTILVNFQDVTSTVTAADVNELLNGANFTRNGNICSAREYFRTMSSGKLDYTNVVVGPFQLSRKRQFYVDNLLVEEALQLAFNDGIDLTQFDSRHENTLDALNILYAGQSQFIGDLWPHNSEIDLQLGSIRTNLYLLTSLGRTPADLSIGTFCHENGHLLCRFPDMYDYGQRDGDSVASAGIGAYCLMGSGNHNGSGKSPSPVCAYLRDLAGWCDNEIDLAAGGPLQAKHGDYNTVIKRRTSRDSEYFLVENRSKMGFDRELPASGLAVYHCDISGSNELQEGSATRHYQCALLQADGRRDLELNQNQGDGDDLFNHVAGIALSSETTPNSREWNGRDSLLALSAISVPGEVITFTAGQAALPQPLSVSGQANPNIEIPDNRNAGISSVITLAGTGTVARIKVGIDIQHPFIGDLRVTLASPAGRVTVLHAQLGGSTDNIVATFDSASPGVLTNMIGQSLPGAWVLNVSDRARRDVGRLRSWRIELSNSPGNAAAAAAEA